jgi:cellulose synthase (UDP-forming)
VRPIDTAYEDRDELIGRLKPLLAGAFTVSGAVYLGWRTTSFNPDAPVVSAIFFVAEVLGFMASLVVFFVALRRRRRRPAPPAQGLAVDVFIPTLDEDLRIVRRTLVAAVRITYPHVTWLLDDGDRPEFRKLAEELGCRYLARRSRRGAKAGNINNALDHASGAFVALLDADHCPQPNFLDRLLGYFDDPEVAFVQTPQDYYNTGSFQHAHGRTSASMWHEQTNFHHVLQPGRDHLNATTLCGCSCVLRRGHIDRIGGFPETTVTEDMHAAVRLQKLGLKSVFHDEPLAFGVAPPDFRGFLRQRLRWGEGNMQVCRIEHVPFTRRLTLRQNISYILLAIAYADSWRKLILYIAPPLTLLFETPPVYGEPRDFLLFFLPYLVCGTLAYSELFGGFGRIFMTEVYDMARLSAGLASSWGLFRRQIGFRVSSKRLVGRSPMSITLPQTLIGMLCVAGIGAALLRWLHVAHGVRPAAAPLWLEMVLVGLCAIHLAFAVGVHRLVRRSAAIDEDNFIFDLELPVRLVGGTRPGPFLWTRAISLDYAWIASLLAPAGPVIVELLLPDGALSVDAEVVSDAGGAPCLRFLWREAPQRDRLDQALHAGRWHRVLAGRSETGQTYLERLGLRRLPVGRTPGAKRPWRPVVLWREDGTPALGYTRDEQGEVEAEMIRFDRSTAPAFGVETQHGRTNILVTGPGVGPMLDEGALDPLGAQRLSIRTAAAAKHRERQARPAGFAAGN